MSNDELETNDKKSGSVMKGILVGIVITLIFEGSFGAVFTPETNLIHRYIAYMMGIVVLFVVAFLAKSKLKMVFLGIPITVIFSFIPPYIDEVLLGGKGIFVSLFGSLGYTKPSLIALLDLAQNSDQLALDSTTSSYISMGLQYFFAIDLLIALIVGTIAGLGLTWIIQIFSKKPGILTIFSFAIALVLLIIGVLLLPYVMVGTSGILQFTTDLGAAGGNMTIGFSYFDGDMSNQTAIALATPYFDDANRYFAEAVEVLLGINAFGLEFLVDQTQPQYKVLVNDGVIVLGAGQKMLEGLSPFLYAFSDLQTGMDVAMGALNLPTTTMAGLSLAATPADFDAGLAQIERGFANFSLALKSIQNGLIELNKIDKAELINSLKTDAPDAATTVNQVFNAISLLNATLDLFDSIIQPININGTLSERAPIIHLLLGALALSNVAKTIGNSTNFAGTEGAFDAVVGNLTVIKEVFNDPAFTNFKNLDYSDDEQLSQIHTEMVGAFNFLGDVSDVAIDIGHFGISIVPILQKTNQTLSFMTDTIAGGTNFLNISDAQFDAAIANMTDIAQVGENLETNANNIESKLTAMKNQPDGYYGSLESSADEFSTMFDGFDLAQNAANFHYLGYAFSNLFVTMKDLKSTNLIVDRIKGNVTVIKESSGNQTQELIDRAPIIKADVVAANQSIDVAKININNARTNLSKAYEDGGMTQLATANDTFTGIETDMTDIQGPQGLGLIFEVMDDPAGYYTDPAKGNNDINKVMSDLEGAITYIGDKLISINNRMQNLNLNA